MKLPARRLRAVYATLLRAHGPQGWWPARSRFEVMVGAILTQNTSWTNVERAIAALRRARALDAETLADMDVAQLAAHLRPVGYFNVKARRLQSFVRWYRASGGYRALDRLPTADLRAKVLGVDGVGPETADDILLYAFARPVFVVDAYTRRLFARLGVLGGGEGYETIRLGFESALGLDAELFNEYHALIVAHAKHVCRTRPRCADCVLSRNCPGRVEG